MKNKNIVSILAILAVCGCQVKELNEVISESKTFTATVEDNFNGGGTRTSLDEQGNVLFKKGDQISIFIGSTINEQFQVTDDSDGKTSASLIQVSGSGFVAGGELESNVAYYPYASATTSAKNEGSDIRGDLIRPPVQYYAEGSFGNGAFPMAAVTTDTDDMRLKFKNVLGGVKLQLTGTATISSISVTGNNDEILCGAAEVTVSNTSMPTISLTDASAKTVTLDCGEGVQLNAETATSFIIALPPMTMESGFTVVVTDTEGKQMEIKTTNPQTINRSKLLKMPAVTYEGTPVARGPLTFISTGETSIALTKVGSPEEITLEYKVNDGEWISYTVGDAVNLTDGQKVSFRAGTSGNSSFSQSLNDYYKFTLTGSGTIAASGSIMSLLNQEESLTIPSSYCFCDLFNGCSYLTEAPELPATTLAENCYSFMFRNCTSLTTALELPATTLAENCYSFMFRNCTSLTTAPELPATTLAGGCYRNMFQDCTSLTTAPELPATTLAENCYSSMFSNCTSLTEAPELPATTLADYCYSGMFRGCTSLIAAPELPVTTLAGGCYRNMFQDCTSLIAAPELPATTLADDCYTEMFSGCTSLSTAPELPATTLAHTCYAAMFSGCTSLIIAPELPATTLAVGCYASMFSGCTSLASAPELPATTLSEECYFYLFQGCSNLNHIKCLATDISASKCLYSWVTGVSSSGVFIKDPDATWPTGDSGIPEGWTVYPTGLPAEVEAVDLGLSVKWANINVGATSPEEYGGYFAWGETEPKADYSWGTYKWCNGSETTLTKYNTKSENGIVDNKTTLYPEDDAARANWGGNWRMPTDAEWTELRNNCTWTCTTQNGVNGRLVTASNGNSIFLPAAGNRIDTDLLDVGSLSYYWSSSLSTDYPYGAWGAGFGSGGVYWDGCYRCYGQSIRPVCP